jgi:HEAT repeat protein
MEGRRRPTGYIVVAVIALVLIGWLVQRYVVKRGLIRDLGTNNMQVRIDAARRLIEMEKLSDSLPAQHIIVRSKTARALGEIGDDDALGVLGEILEDQEEAPRRWARNALVAQGMRAMPVLFAALSAGGGTQEEALNGLEQIAEDIGPQRVAAQLRFFLSDGSAAAGAAEACARVGAVGIDALLRACYNDHDKMRDRGLGNLGKEGIEAAVEPALYNLEPLDKSRKGGAIKALGLIGDPSVVPAIIPFLEDKDNREAAATALGRIGDARAVEPIVATLMETEKRYRNAAILALRRLGPGGFPALTRELRSDEVLMRRGAAAALVGSRSPRVNGPLTTALRDPDAEVRASAALALGWPGNIGVVPALVGALSDTSWQVVDAAVTALGDIGLHAIHPLLNVLRDPSSDLTVRYQISRAFAAIGRPAVPKLTVALRDSDPDVVTWCAVALGEIGDQRAVAPLQELADRADPDLRWVLEEQLRRLATL